LPQLQYEVGERALVLINNLKSQMTALNDQQDSQKNLLAAKLIQYAKLGLENAAHSHFKQSTLSDLKQLLESVIETCDSPQAVTTHSINPLQWGIRHLLSEKDLTQHSDDQVVGMAKRLVLHFIHDGAYDSDIESRFGAHGSIYYQHHDPEIRAAANERMIKLVEKNLKHGSIGWVHSRLAQADPEVKQQALALFDEHIRTEKPGRILSRYLEHQYHQRESEELGIGPALKDRFFQLIDQERLAVKDLLNVLPQIHYQAKYGNSLFDNESLTPLLAQFARVFDDFDAENSEPTNFYHNQNYHNQNAKQLAELALTSYFYDHEQGNIKNAARRFAAKSLNACLIKTHQEFDQWLKALELVAGDPQDIEKKNLRWLLEAKLHDYLDQSIDAKPYFGSSDIIPTQDLLKKKEHLTFTEVSEKAHQAVNNLKKKYRESILGVDRQVQEKQLLADIGLEDFWEECILSAVEAGDYDEKLCQNHPFQTPFGRSCRDKFQTAFKQRVIHLLGQGQFDSQLKTIRAKDLLDPKQINLFLDRAALCYEDGYFDEELIQAPWDIPFTEPKVVMAARSRLLTLIESDPRPLPHLGQPHYVDHQDSAIRAAVKSRLNQLTQGRYCPEAKPVARLRSIQPALTESKRSNEGGIEKPSSPLLEASNASEAVIEDNADGGDEKNVSQPLNEAAEFMSKDSLVADHINKDSQECLGEFQTNAQGREKQDLVTQHELTSLVTEVAATSSPSLVTLVDLPEGVDDESDASDWSIEYDYEGLEQRERPLNDQLNQRIGAELASLAFSGKAEVVSFPVPLTFLSEDILKLNHLQSNDRLWVAINADNYNVAIKVLRGKSVIFEENGPEKTFPIGYKLRLDIDRTVAQMQQMGQPHTIAVMHHIYNQTVASLDHLSSNCFHCDGRLASPSLKPVPCHEGRCQSFFEQLKYGADYLSLKDEPKRFELIRQMFIEAGRVDPKRLSLIFAKNWPMNILVNETLDTDDKRLAEVLRQLNKVPNAHDFPKDTPSFQQTLSQLNKHTRDTLGWLLSRTRNLLDQFDPDTQGLANNALAFRIMNDPVKEANFKIKAQGKSTQMTYHGTEFGNVIGILTYSLQSLSGTEFETNGALFGKGVYHSNNMNVALGYSRKNVAFDQNSMRGVFVCESIVEDAQANKPDSLLSKDISVEPEPDKIILRALICFSERGGFSSLAQPTGINAIPLLNKQTYFQSLREQIQQAIDIGDITKLRAISHLLPPSDASLKQKVIEAELRVFNHSLLDSAYYEHLVLEDLLNLDEYYLLFQQPQPLIQKVLEPGLKAYVKYLDQKELTVIKEMININSKDSLKAPMAKLKDQLVRAYAVLCSLDTDLQMVDQAYSANHPKAFYAQVLSLKKELHQRVQAFSNDQLHSEKLDHYKAFVALIDHHDYYQAEQYLEQTLKAAVNLDADNYLKWQLLLNPCIRMMSHFKQSVSSNTLVDTATIYGLQRGIVKIKALKEQDTFERQDDWDDYTQPIDRSERPKLRFAYETLKLLLELETPRDHNRPNYFPRLSLTEQFTQTDSEVTDEMIYFYSPSVLSSKVHALDSPADYVIPVSKYEGLEDQSTYACVPRLAYHRESESGMLRRLAVDYANVIVHFGEGTDAFVHLIENAFSNKDPCAGARHERLHEYLVSLGVEGAFDLLPDLDKSMSDEIKCQNLIHYFQKKTLFQVGEQLKFPFREVAAGKHKQTVQNHTLWKQLYSESGFRSFLSDFLTQEDAQAIFGKLEIDEKNLLIEDYIKLSKSYNLF